MLTKTPCPFTIYVPCKSRVYKVCKSYTGPPPQQIKRRRICCLPVATSYFSEGCFAKRNPPRESAVLGRMETLPKGKKNEQKFLKNHVLDFHFFCKVLYFYILITYSL